MPYPVHSKRRRPLNWGDYYSLWVIFVAIVLAGPAVILYAVYADHRDRPSLQWPKVSGIIMQCREVYHGGKKSHYSVAVSYNYAVNGRHYEGSRIALWSEDFYDRATRQFVSEHPVKSPVDVYYDPQHPENAALIPGPDEAGNRNFIRAGGIATVFGVLSVFLMRRQIARTKAQILATEAKRARGPAKLGSLPHGFASYEPGSKRKLNVFPDQECLDEVLGHDGKPLQEWQPDDRVIDAAGREYRLVKEPGQKGYNLDPTGQSWSYEQLLDAAEEDGRLLKQDPEVLRRRLNDVPEADRMAALLKAIDEMPAGPRWAMATFILFLVLFFLAVVFVVGALFTWLEKH